MFKIKFLKTYAVSQLYHFSGVAMLSQGNGCRYSRMLENRINLINKELLKRGNYEKK
jgi:hypothetical protein